MGRRLRSERNWTVEIKNEFVAHFRFTRSVLFNNVQSFSLVIGVVVKFPSEDWEGKKKSNGDRRY